MNDILIYVLSLVPSSTSIIGLIITIAIGVCKIRKAGNDATVKVNELTKSNVELRKEMIKVMQENKTLKEENIEIKREQRKINARLEHMYFVEDKEGE